MKINFEVAPYISMYQRIRTERFARSRHTLLNYPHEQSEAQSYEIRKKPRQGPFNAKMRNVMEPRIVTNHE